MVMVVTLVVKMKMMVIMVIDLNPSCRYPMIIKKIIDFKVFEHIAYFCHL